VPFCLSTWKISNCIHQSSSLSQGINMLYFAYDYFPGAVTVAQQCLAPDDQSGRFLQENVIWSFVCQIVSALRKVHSAGLACRVVHPSKILITGKNRLRLVGTGIFDVINFDSTNRTAIARHQQEDLLSLGRLILMLCCRTSDLNSLRKPVDVCSVCVCVCVCVVVVVLSF
jgi:serine/threonine protein kinase